MALQTIFFRCRFQIDERFRFHRKRFADRRIKTGVRAVAILGHSFVNYVVGKYPSSYLCPKNLCLRVTHEISWLYDSPELQTAPDGREPSQSYGNTTPAN
jgi:hypothetical protein